MKNKSNSVEYAIVDIETTGGSAHNGRITEVAILIHDGEKVIDRYETLINPGRSIPYSITMLTGIDSETVAHAPYFEEVAHKIHSLLKNKIFVAHNVNFDYSFLKNQLEATGYPFTTKKLCTVRLSRKLKPGFPSYSLGVLCERLGIPIENRHRAMGDATATTILFSKLLEWDDQELIPRMLKNDSKEQQLPANLPKEEFEKIPEQSGVYYFHDQAGNILYIGKAVNLKKRVFSHFTGHNAGARRQSFLQSIYSISFEICATELICLLYECSEIKHYWPPFNRALKKYEASFAIYTYTDINGYKRLVAGKVRPNQLALQKYYREWDAVNDLLKSIENHDVDIRLCNFGQQADSFDAASNPKLKNKELPEVEIHNQKIEQIREDLHSERKTYAILDKGRTNQELSCIWIEKGEFYGMGYIDRNSDLNSLEEIKESLTPHKANHYMMHLVETFVEKYPEKQVKIEEGNLQSISSFISQ